MTEEHPVSSRYPTPSQTLLLTACPLAGPIPQLSAWTMTRVTTFAGRAYEQLMAGLVILLITVLAAAAVLIQLTLSWSRHVSGIQTALAAHDLAELPPIAKTGERELRSNRHRPERCWPAAGRVASAGAGVGSSGCDGGTTGRDRAHRGGRCA